MQPTWCAVVVLVRGETEVARWPLPAVYPLDLAVVDQVARLQLAARRAGCEVRLGDACPDLRDLLELVGLAELLPPADPTA